MDKWRARDLMCITHYGEGSGSVVLGYRREIVHLTSLALVLNSVYIRMGVWRLVSTLRHDTVEGA